MPDMEKRRPRKEGQNYGGMAGDARRILNLTDGSEKPLGEWNTMVIDARDRAVTVWVNGDLVKNGLNATTDRGKIAIQAEGAEVEFRKVEIGPLKGNAVPLSGAVGKRRASQRTPGVDDADISVLHRNLGVRRSRPRADSGGAGRSATRGRSSSRKPRRSASATAGASGACRSACQW